MNQDTKIYLSLGVIVILIIIGIYLVKNLKDSEELDEDTMKCLASNSIMYSQNGCSHCITQKNILGNYTGLFNIIECNEDDNLKKCSDAGITATPTWIINSQKYS